MKKIKILVAAVLAFFAGNAMAQSITVDDITVEPNGQANLVVKYGGVQAAAAQFDLVLPEGVNIVEGSNPVKEELISSGFTVVSNDLDDGSKRYLIYSLGGNQFASESGKLLTIPVEVGDVAEGAITGGEIKNVKVAKKDASSVGDVSNVALNINVGQAAVKGDVNGDGVVSVSDITETVNILLGSSEYNAAADFDNDGSVTVKDLVTEIDYVFPSTVAAKPQFAPSAKAAVNNLTAKGGTSVVLNLDNSTAYRALQFDLTLPEGLEIGDVQLASSASGMEMLTNKLEGNKWRVLVAGLDGQAILGANAGSFINVKIDGTTSDDAIIDNIIFADSHANGTKFDNMVVKVFGGNATGINGINADTNAEAVKDIYSVGGAARKDLQRGVNIVRDAAGKVTKVIKK